MVESINRQEVEKKVDKVAGQLEDGKVKPEQVQKELIATAQNLQSLPVGGRQALNSFFELIGELLAKLGAAFRQLNGSWALDVQDGDTSSLTDAQQLTGGKPTEAGGTKPKDKPKEKPKAVPKPKEGYAEPVLKAEDFTGLVGKVEGLKAVEAGQEGPKLTLDLVGGLKDATAEIIPGKDGKPEKVRVQKDGVSIWISLADADITGTKQNVLDGINPRESERALTAIIDRINQWMGRYYKYSALAYENGLIANIDVINGTPEMDLFDNVTVPYNSTNANFDIPSWKGFISPPPLKEDSLSQIDKIATGYKDWMEKGRGKLWKILFSQYAYTISNDSWEKTQLAEKIRDWINSAIQKIWKQKNQQFTS